MRSSTWPGGYRTGFCLVGNHGTCKGGIWSPATGLYITCSCKDCTHPVTFDEDAEEEFFGEENERDPFIFSPGEKPKIFGGAIILEDDEEEEEFFQVEEEEEEEEFF